MAKLVFSYSHVDEALRNGAGMGKAKYVPKLFVFTAMLYGLKGSGLKGSE